VCPRRQERRKRGGGSEGDSRYDRDVFLCDQCRQKKCRSLHCELLGQLSCNFEQKNPSIPNDSMTKLLEHREDLKRSKDGRGRTDNLLFNRKRLVG
jgi:hypothetical protein